MGKRLANPSASKEPHPLRCPVGALTVPPLE